METTRGPQYNKQSFFEKMLEIKPLCESSRYLAVWSVITAIIFLVFDMTFEKHIEKSAYKIYKGNEVFYKKYKFDVFLKHIYSIMGYNKSFKYINFILEIFMIPFGIYFYNNACERNMEYLNYILLLLFLIIFISKVNMLLNTERTVNNEVNKSYM